MGKKCKKFTTVAGDYIRELCKKFPETPSLTLAKKAIKDEPELFRDLEHAHKRVRYYRGLTGKADRDYLKDKDLIKKPIFNYNPFNLPDSHSEVKNVFKLPKHIKKVLVLSDIHFPYQDNEALTTALEYGLKQKVDAVFINGDMLDFYQVSFHEKDPRKTSIAEELEMGRQFLKSLRHNFLCPIYYIPGNHEYRLERYLKVKAPELLDVQEFKLDILLRCGEFRIEYLPYASKVYFGKLLVEHGDKMKGAGGVNPARTLLMRFKRPVLCGHFHRTTSANSKVYDDSIHMAWSTGCLCELEPGYMELNEHNHGFAVVDVYEDDTFSVDNKQIINGRVF